MSPRAADHEPAAARSGNRDAQRLGKASRIIGRLTPHAEQPPHSWDRRRTARITTACSTSTICLGTSVHRGPPCSVANNGAPIEGLSSDRATAMPRNCRSRILPHSSAWRHVAKSADAGDRARQASARQVTPPTSMPPYPRRAVIDGAARCGACGRSRTARSWRGREQYPRSRPSPERTPVGEPRQTSAPDFGRATCRARALGRVR